MDVAYIALGSNLGDRAAHLDMARAAIAALDRTAVLAISSVEETAPLGPIPQDPYLNQMIAVTTELSPRELLERLHGIERSAGRERRERWGPRTLDLDIVLFERQAVDEPGLTVPHPELANRDFWQREILELRGAS
ncbi:MAG TPA: 2-amino-4-hydroxy-6-hydroxymethyldihydropteridine diphosphokinase [Gemmatimonadaceae bacterium]|nr:2-amino-4-hydroxy-6-hydroxymethyldihydropteridine diphosphokinase [Gemmatimonadaceae bacterium]